MLRIVMLFMALGSFVGKAAADDFALITDLEKAVIFYGSMSKKLADLKPIPLTGVLRPTSVDYDPVDRMVYWYDLNCDHISRAHLDGSNQTILVERIAYSDGLALDVESRYMYWTDAALEEISRAPMDGGNKEVIVRTGNPSSPRSIITDHDRGHFYWTDVHSSNTKIARADFDGGNERVLVSERLHWANGIALDKEGGFIYWCDASEDGPDVIERVDLEGNDRTQVLKITEQGSGSHPYDIALYGGSIFWTDWKRGTVQLFNVTANTVGDFGKRVFSKAGGIHIHELNECDSSSCGNGATCTDEVNGFSCECPVGFEGITCSVELNECDSSPCANGATCTDEVNGFSCECPVGFEGITCSVELNECDSSPCANGATCTDEVNGFSCECPVGFEGITCSVGYVENHGVIVLSCVGALVFFAIVIVALIVRRKVNSKCARPG